MSGPRDPPALVQALVQALVHVGGRAPCGCVSGAITARDFRTWHGSVLALALGERADPSPRLAAEVVRQVADRLRNSPALCRTRPSAGC